MESRDDTSSDRAWGQLIEATAALSESLTLSDVLPRFIEKILPLVGADFAAFGTLSSEHRASLIWLPTRHEPPLLKHYELVQRDDFVAKALRHCPNEVRRDQEMIRPKDLRRNLMFTTAMDMGEPLRHVMAFTVLGRDGSFGGLSMYRSGMRPFSERDSFWLTQTIAHMRNALVNSRTVELERACFDAIAIEKPWIFLDSNGREWKRLQPADELLDKWFRDVERSPGKIPDVLMEQWRIRKSQDPSGRRDDLPYVHPRDDNGKRLNVHFVPLPRPAGMWAIVLKEYSVRPELPPDFAWRHKLTKLEAEAALLILEGLSEKDIASALSITQSAAHERCRSVYDKCDIQGRSGFIACVDAWRRKLVR